MVIRQKQERNWVDFEEGKNNFSSESDQTTENARERKPRRASGSAWMQEPIRADNSLVPMAAPNAAAVRSGSSRPPSPSVKSNTSKSGARPSSRQRNRSGADSPAPKAPRPSQPVRAASPASRGSARPPPIEHHGNEANMRPPASRGRANSRTRAPQEKRERSVSQTRSIGGASQCSQGSRRSKARPSGKTRPPVTKNGREVVQRGRSRSAQDGRARTDRSRSVSLTRVTNAPQAPPSPGVRSVRSVQSQSNSVRRTAPPQRQPTEVYVNRNSSNLSRSDASQDGNIGRDINVQRQNPRSGSSVCSTDSRAKRSMMGKLLGMQSKKPGGFVDQIRPRVLLAATVYHNAATGLWITTINTNQKGVARDPKMANKYLKAFSFPTEQEARESAIANAPPKMVPFGENNNCFICQNSFTMFKRASHCRNCGVCICKDCSVVWPSKMLPDTYNLKNEATAKVCTSCNTISSAFRRSLLQGDFRGAAALYGTGNVNLRVPFPSPGKKDEVMWPVHCAVEGGNIDILRWLVDDHFCPITTVPSGAKKPRRGAPENLISTSNGRNVLSIAVERLKVDMMQYLVVDRGVSIYESKNLESSLRALEATLTALPRTVEGRQPVDEAAEPRWDTRSFQDDMSIPSTIGVDDKYDGNMSVGGTSQRTKSADCCIICFDRKIDCVATPCGHQVCCLECSSSLSLCPVCNQKGNFIKIFRP